LTGALNRERLREEIATALAAAARYREPAALCVIDLDNLRFVNEAHGHAAGDRMLAAAAGAVRARLRTTDALGRIGADELGVLLPRTEPAAARAVAGELLAALRTGACIDVGERPVHVTASIGVATVAAGADVAPTDLLAEADMAMRAAKEAGRDRVVVAEALGQGSAHARTSLAHAARIRDALETGGLELHAQPIVPVRGAAPPRHELLVRLGDVPPPELIAVAERFGQIQAIDGWVLGRALDLLGRGGTSVLQVNLGAASMCDGDLMGFAERAILAAGVAPERLVFEITETAALADLDAARGAAGRLRALGCGLALDDFGAGYASFAHLKRLPFDILKIDGEFVRALPSDRVDRLAVGAIAQVARGLGMQTIAEYVSDEATLHALAELGVDHAQGFHVGVPRPVGELFA
jgi:diguanylate cyclase (GGDEF)-like protein